MKTETMNLIIGILIGIIIASLGFTIYYGSISNNPQIPGNMQMSGDRMEPPDRPSGEGMPGGPSQGNGGPGENMPGGSNGGMGGNQNVSVNYSAVKEIKSDEEISNTTISSKMKDENAILTSGKITVTLADIIADKTGDSDGGDCEAILP